MTATVSGMKVEITDVQPWVKKLSIEIPLEKVASESEAQWRQVAKQAKIPGFRPGKAPRHIVENLYGESILGEVGNKLINDGYRTAVAENHLEVFGEPDFHDVSVEKGKPISFIVVVETFPIIPMPDFAGWEFERVVGKVAEKSLQHEVDSLLDRFAELVPAEGRAAREGDHVFLDVTGSVDGKEERLLSAKGDRMVLSTDEKNLLRDLHKNIVGMSAGEEKEVGVKLPKQFPNAEFAGKNADFKVRVNSVKEVRRPEFDDEFAAAHSKFKTAAELRDSLSEALRKHEADHAEEKLRADILKKFRERAVFDLPPKLAAHYSEMYANRQAGNARSLGMDLRKTPGFNEAEFEKRCREKGEEAARNEVVLESIGKAEKLAPDEEKLNALRSEYASFLESKDEHDRRNAVMYILKEAMEESVFKFIYGKVKIADKTAEPTEVKEND
ncbi:MAG: trigger factor [Nitrospinae bacterium]|nr:trigger factor [Nitrospinota bacterium]